jgi:hypothetical protein
MLVGVMERVPCIVGRVFLSICAVEWEPLRRGFGAGSAPEHALENVWDVVLVAQMIYCAQSYAKPSFCCSEDGGGF